MIKDNYIKMYDTLKKNGYSVFSGRRYDDDLECKYRIEFSFRSDNGRILNIDLYNDYKDGKEIFNIIVDFSHKLELNYDKKQLLFILDFIKKAA